MSRDRARVGLLLALTAAGLWGVSSSVAAAVFDVVDPARVAQVRAVIAAGVLLPYAARTGRLRTTVSPWWFLLLGANLAVVNVTYYWAIEALGVGPGVTLQFLGPVIVLGWMALVQRRRVAGLAWVAASVAVAGVGLVTEAWRFDGGDLLGVAAGLGAAATFASYLLLGERLGSRAPAVTVVTWGFVAAAVVWLIVLPVWWFPPVDAASWARLAWVGVAGTALPFLAELAALRRLASGLVGVVATSEPAIGAGTAWLLLGQALSPAQVVGMFLVMGAVASIQRWGLPAVEVPLDAAR